MSGNRALEEVSDDGFLRQGGHIFDNLRRLFPVDDAQDVIDAIVWLNRATQRCVWTLHTNAPCALEWLC